VGAKDTDNKKRLIALRNKISEWLRNPRVGRLGLSRTLMDRGHGEPQLPELCRWIKDKDFSKEDVIEVFHKWKDRYEGQISGGGLKRDAGGEARFKKRQRELLSYLDMLLGPK